MMTLAEIESAIEKLPAPQLDELSQWLEALRSRRLVAPPSEAWLKVARGAASGGATTSEVLAATRGEP